MAQINREKRKYEKKLKMRLLAKDVFLIQRLQKEWRWIEDGIKREEMIRRMKSAGLNVAKTILVLAAIAGVISIAVVAPNIFSIFGGRSFRRNYFKKSDTRQALYYLKKQGYLIMDEESSEIKKFSITERGREMIFSDTFDKLKINKQSKWDGIWRIVVFDIPDVHKWSREGFREKLKSMGFYQLQKSVFITPYPCWEEISCVASIYGVFKYTRFIDAKKIFSDADLKGVFDINS